MLLTAWRFYIWLVLGRRSQAIWFGVAFSLALLSKSTALLLIPLFTVMFTIYGIVNQTKWNWKARLIDYFLAGVVCLLLIHVCYEFQGVGRPLGDFNFVSQTLTGRQGALDVGNRFEGTLLGSVPSLLPADYVIGIDLQKLDFEEKFDSYLMGTWAGKGWWYYYIVALFLKEPLALWILVAFAVVRFHQRSGFGQSRTKLQREIILYAPGLLVFVFVSSQTGFNHHLRYVLPIFPCLYLVVVKLVAKFSWHELLIALCLTGWYICSSISIFPHSHAFFSEIVGGHKEGWRYLSHSNLDWGQDLYTIQDWTRNNSDKSPVFILYNTPLPFECWGVVGVDGQSFLEDEELKEGYWVVGSQWKLLHPNPYFRENEPTVVLSPVTSVYKIDGNGTN